MRRKIEKYKFEITLFILYASLGILLLYLLFIVIS